MSEAKTKFEPVDHIGNLMRERDRASDACATVQRERDEAVEVLKWYADQMCEGWCDGDPKAAAGIGAENCAGCPARAYFADKMDAPQ